MTPTKHSAMYVMIDQHGGRVYAVYDNGVSPRDLVWVAERLNTLRGVEARATRVALDDPQAAPTTVVWMSARHGADAERAGRLFKRLANPALAIGVGFLGVKVLICDCKYVSTQLADIRFIRGFTPDDNEAFMLRYYAAIQRLDVAGLLSKKPRPPYKPLADGLDNMLEKLGAHVSQLQLLPGRDTRTCVHAD